MVHHKERARSFCFTLNNYTIEDINAIYEWECKYCVVGKEVGENGTPHLQGYVVFDNARSLEQLKKLAPRAHWEIARGTFEQNFEYCTKDGDWREKGERPLSAKEKGEKGGSMEKDRWANALKAVREKRYHDVDDEILCKHLKTTEYAVLRQRVMDRELETLDGSLEHEWFVGKTGSGKSMTARHENPEAYVKDPQTVWWDGYVDEDVVIIDDFDKFQVKQGGDMKRWLDRYPFQAQFKGGYQLIRPKKIIVTSQYLPCEIWDDEKTVDAIMRRVAIRNFDEIVIPPMFDPAFRRPAAAALPHVATVDTIDDVAGLTDGQLDMMEFDPAVFDEDTRDTAPAVFVAPKSVWDPNGLGDRDFW